MNRFRLILTVVLFLAGCLQLSAQVDCYEIGDQLYIPIPGTHLSEIIEFSSLPLPAQVTLIEDYDPVTGMSFDIALGSPQDARTAFELKNCDFIASALFRRARAAAAVTASSTAVATQSARDFTAADFNGDGLLDSAAIVGSRLQIQLLDSNTKPIGGSPYTLPGQGASVIAADVNGDGKQDLVVALLNPPGGVAVLLGNGNGTFQQPKTYASAGADMYSVTAADFNGDGKVDLAVTTNICYTSNTNGVLVLLGNGDGSFRAPVSYTAGSCPADLLAVDLNRDGKFDLAVTDGITPNLYVLPGRGDGTFNSAISSPVNGSVRAIATADLNTDGIPDLALAIDSSAAVGILLGKGDGSFQAPVQYAVGADPQSLALAPLAGGFMTVTLDNAASAMVITPGTAQGTLKAPVVQLVGGSSQPALADATGDGKPDVVLVASSNTPGLLVLPGDGTGKFGAPVTVPLNAPAGYGPIGYVGGCYPFCGDMALGDLNGDGIPDVVLPVVAFTDTARITGIGVMLGKKGGGFQPMNVTPLSDTSLAVVLGDFNNDGKPDAAVRTASGISLLPGNGDGTFKPPVQTAIATGTTPGGVTVALLAAGDFNRDGKLDLFVVGTSGPVVLPGNGSGGFGAPVPVAVGGLGVTWAVVGDLNGDGILDVAVADVNSGQAAVLPGKGDGTFRAAIPVAIDTNPFRLALVDWNGDGYPDLAIGHCCGALESVVYLNNGDGTFGAGIHLPSGPSPTYLTAGDLTGAGKVGIVSVAGVTGVPNVSGSVTVTPSPYPAALPTRPVSASPNTGNSASQKFTFTYQAAAGYQSLSIVNVLINSALDGGHACYIAFLPATASSGTVVLVDDAGDAGGPFAGTLALPGSGTIANSQCSVNASGSSVSASRNSITLTLSVSFTASFSGNKIVYLAARDNSGNNSGWQPLSTWGVPGPAIVGPAVSGVTGGTANSLLQTYHFVFTDTKGWQDIAIANALVNSALDAKHACYIAFVPSGPASGTVLVVDDAGDAGGPFGNVTLPGSGGAGNSQCFVSGAGASVSGSGNTLTLTLPIAFDPAFAGNQIVFLATRSNTANSGWQPVGTVSVP
jgi:hypothetical protein